MQASSEQKEEPANFVDAVVGPVELHCGFTENAITEQTEEKAKYKHADVYTLYDATKTHPCKHIVFHNPNAVKVEQLNEIVQEVEESCDNGNIAISLTGLLPSVVAACRYPFEDMGIVVDEKQPEASPAPMFLWRRKGHFCHIESGVFYKASVIPIVKHFGMEVMLLFTTERDPTDFSTPLLNHIYGDWHGSKIDMDVGCVNYSQIALRGLKQQTGIDLAPELLKFGCESQSITQHILSIPHIVHCRTYVAYIDSSNKKDDRSGLIQSLFQNLSEREVRFMDETKSLLSHFGLPTRGSAHVYAFKLPSRTKNPDFEKIGFYELGDKCDKWAKQFMERRIVSETAKLIAFILCHPSEACCFSRDGLMVLSETIKFNIMLPQISILERVPRDAAFFDDVVTQTTLTAKIDARSQKVICGNGAPGVRLRVRSTSLSNIPFMCRLLLEYTQKSGDRFVRGDVILDYVERLLQPQPNSDDSKTNMEKALARDTYGNNVLHYAAAHNFSQLIREPFNLWQRNCFGMTPCHVAIVARCKDALRFLPNGRTLPLIETDFGPLGIFDFSCMMGMPLELGPNEWQRHSVFNSNNIQSLVTMCPSAVLPAFLRSN